MIDARVRPETVKPRREQSSRGSSCITSAKQLGWHRTCSDALRRQLDVLAKPLTSTSSSLLQGEGRGFETLSAHRLPSKKEVIMTHMKITTAAVRTR
jgi:hypothetical protein